MIVVNILESIDMSNTWYDHADPQWIDATRRLDMSSHYNRFLSLLNPGACILDLCCGAGRDSLYFSNLGYDVEALDNSAYMCQLTREYTHGKVMVHCSDVQMFTPNKQYDAVWAMAALVHADDSELKQMFNTISNILKPNGIFYTMFKLADVEWTDANGRYFNAISEDKIKHLLIQSGIQTESVYIEPDLMGRDTKWLSIVSKNNHSHKYDEGFSF